jgi:putative transposase
MIAARLFAQGKSLTEVAAVVGCSKSSASRWKQAWKSGGEAALRPLPHPGPKPKLNPRQERRLLAALKRGTQHWGYAVAGWTGPLVRDLIRQLFGVRYHVDYIGTLLHRLGYSSQQPEQRARERNERAIAQWRRDEWPRLKKERSAAS